MQDSQVTPVLSCFYASVKNWIMITPMVITGEITTWMDPSVVVPMDDLLKKTVHAAIA